MLRAVPSGTVEKVQRAAGDLEPTFACSPPPGTARVDAVLTAAGGRAPQWALERLPEGYRGVVAPFDAHARDGLAAAWAAGLAASTAPVVALLDGRSGVDPRELERLAEPVARGSADLVLAVRRGGWGPGSLLGWPPHRRSGAAAAGRRLSRRLAEPAVPALRDTAGRPLVLRDGAPALAGRRQLLAAVADGSGRAGPEELLVAAAGQGWRVAQVEVRCTPGLLLR